MVDLLLIKVHWLKYQSMKNGNFVVCLILSLNLCELANKSFNLSMLLCFSELLDDFYAYLCTLTQHAIN